MYRDGRGGDWGNNQGSSQNWEQQHDGGMRLRRSPRGHYKDDDGPPESVAVLDEQGYQSAGALSDGPSMMLEQGYARSSASVGSQGSGGEQRFVIRQQQQAGLMAFQHVMNGETRFPSSYSYAASEAAKSDIATVCSGSVVEDIEVASVLSAEYNMANTTGLFPSPTSAKSTRTTASARVEFAAEFSSSKQQHAGSFANMARQRSSLSDVNDMGPPLSRALLMQQHPAHQGSSRPGSVRSFGSTAGTSSDVVAHVDTDDCGGSLVGSFTDGHSVHSQDDAKTEEEAAPQKEANDSSSAAALQNADDSIPNGRVSPGGTVYKGRGVRRYQGRHMHLPLKRFHQNGVHLEARGFTANDYPDDARYDIRQYDDRRQRSRGRSPRRELKRPERRNGYHRRQRSRSRSPPARSRTPPRGHNGRNRRRNNNKSPTRYNRRDRYSSRSSDGRSDASPRRYDRRRHRSGTRSNSR